MPVIAAAMGLISLIVAGFMLYFMWGVLRTKFSTNKIITATVLTGILLVVFPPLAAIIFLVAFWYSVVIWFKRKFQK